MSLIMYQIGVKQNKNLSLDMTSTKFSIYICVVEFVYVGFAMLLRLPDSIKRYFASSSVMNISYINVRVHIKNELIHSFIVDTSHL